MGSGVLIEEFVYVVSVLELICEALMTFIPNYTPEAASTLHIEILSRRWYRSLNRL